jgi:hypothetical protein
MTADWYLFWTQNNARPVWNELDLEMWLINRSFVEMGSVFRTAVGPVFSDLARSMAKACESLRIGGRN